MRYITLFALIVCSACGGGSNSPFGEDITHFYAPAAGTVVAADSVKIKDDLNSLYYSVRLTAGDSSSEGRYNLRAAFGYNEAKSEVVYPRLLKGITPAIRKEEGQPYSFIIGFRYTGDTAFNDYLRVYATHIPGFGAQIELRYIKAYYIDTTAKK